MKVSAVACLAVVAAALLPARPGFCAPETLSHFLETNVQGKVIVMEGDRFIDKEHDALVDILKAQLTPEKRLAAIAEKCDYTVIPDEGSFLLRKQYSDPRELPCVSAEEITAYVQDVAQTTAPLRANAQGDWTEQTFHLLKSLPAEQWEAVKTSTLPVRDLSPEQRKMFDGMMLEVFYGDIQRLSSRYTELWRSPTKAKILSKIISNYPTTVFQGGSDAENFADVFVAKFAPGKDEAEAAEHLNASPDATDLQDVLARLNPPGQAPIFFAAKPLLHTPVVVINLKSASARQVMRNIGHLHAFRLLSNTETVKLERQTVAMGDVTDIGPRVAAALPSPIKRTVDRNNFDDVPVALLASLIPVLDKAPTHSIPLQGLTRLQRTALAFNLFKRLYMEIHDAARGLPDDVRNVDNISLKFRRTPGTGLGFKTGTSFALVVNHDGMSHEMLQSASIYDVDRP